MQTAVLPILLFVGCVVGLAVALLALGYLFNPKRPGRVKRMPYESGMDPIHDTRRRFDVRFHLLAIAFLVFDVELLFLYPWAVALHSEQGPAALTEVTQAQGGVGDTPSDGALPTPTRPLVRPVFAGGMLFIALLVLGFVYDWRKGVFRWR